MEPDRRGNAVTDLTDKQLIDVITRGLKENAKRFAALRNAAKAQHTGATGRAGTRNQAPKRHRPGLTVGSRKK